MNCPAHCADIFIKGIISDDYGSFGLFDKDWTNLFIFLLEFNVMEVRSGIAHRLEEVLSFIGGVADFKVELATLFLKL